MSDPTNHPERAVVVTGAGVISPLADEPRALHAALAAGTSALGAVELFALDGLRCRLGAEVKGFEPATYLGEGNLRPLDRTARLTAAAAGRALEASGWTKEDLERREVGLVLGTMFGSVRTIAEFDRRALTAGPIYAKPMDFANSVINAAAGQTAIWHGLRGVNSTISAGSASGLQALGYAADLIASGRADALLAGGGEELCFESFFGFYRTGLMGGSSNGAGPQPYPFDARRNGFALGEGAVLLMLEEEGAARRRGARILARLCGHGTGFDPTRGRDGSRAARALAGAVSRALCESGLAPADLDAWSASANGSPTGDRVEAEAVAAALGERAGTLPATAVKSMLGESLGAGGAFQTLALLGALSTGELPGVHGFEATEEGLPAPALAARTRPLAGRRGLVTCLGLDGNAAALVLEAERAEAP